MSSARLYASYIFIFYLLECSLGQSTVSFLDNQQQRAFNNINGIEQQHLQRNVCCNICKSKIANPNTRTSPPNVSQQPCGQQTTNPVTHLELLKKMQQRQLQFNNLSRQKQQQKCQPQLNLSINSKPGLPIGFSQKQQVSNPIPSPGNLIDIQPSNNQVPKVHFTIPCSCPTSSDPEFVPIPFKLLPDLFNSQTDLGGGNMQANENVVTQTQLQNSAYVQNQVLNDQSLQPPENQASSQSPQNDQSSFPTLPPQQVLPPQQQNYVIPQYPLPLPYMSNYQAPVEKRKSSSLKALLPLLFSLLKENNQCSCVQCNCGCMNISGQHLPQVFSGYSTQKSYGLSSYDDSSVYKGDDDTDINIVEEESATNSTEITSEENDVTNEENFIADEVENQNNENELTTT